MPFSQIQADKTKQHRLGLSVWLWLVWASLQAPGWPRPQQLSSSWHTSKAGLQALLPCQAHMKLVSKLSTSFPITLPVLEPSCLTLPMIHLSRVCGTMGLFLPHPLPPYALRVSLYAFSSLDFLHFASLAPYAHLEAFEIARYSRVTSLFIYGFLYNHVIGLRQMSSYTCPTLLESLGTFLIYLQNSWILSDREVCNI